MTGAPDAQGVYRYAEDDLLYPFSAFMNLGQDSISTQLAQIRSQLTASWSSYTPTIVGTTTSPNLGNGVSGGRFVRMGRTVHTQGYWQFGNTGVSAGAGTYRVRLPVPPIAGSQWMIGTAWLFDASGALTQLAAVANVYADNGGEVTFRAHGGNAELGATVPWSWTINDQFRWSFTYEAASA